MEQFKLKARLLKLLGEELIASQHLAIFELVKNAYDADATSVNVFIKNPSDETKTEISILDDGCGMDLETIQNCWLVLGSDSKQKMVDSQELTQKYKRFPMGSKGIGRFAAYKLGNKLKLNTKKENQPEYEVIIDLDDALKKEYIEDVKISIEQLSKSEEKIKTTSGTLITISKIRSKLSDKSINDLNKQLLTIISPFKELDEKNPFNIHMGCPELPGLESDPIQEILHDALYKFNFIFENGILKYTYEFNPNNQLTEETGLIKRKVEKEDDALAFGNPETRNISQSLFGKITGTFYVYDLSSAILKKYISTGSRIKTYLDENYGVRVYRNGIRVYSYGMPGNDWLELDRQRINNVSTSIGNRNIIGAINLEPNTVNILKEKTNREGFIEDENYNIFTNIVNVIINKFATEYRNHDKSLLYDKLSGSKVINTTTINKPIENLKEKLNTSGFLSEVSKEIDQITKSYEQMKTVVQNSGSAMQAIMSFHELEKILKRVDIAIDKGDIKLIKKELDFAITIVNGMGDLFKKEKLCTCSLKSIIEDALSLSANRFQRHGIKIVHINEHIDFQSKVYRRLVIGAILNLIDNAVYWMDVKWQGIENAQRTLYIGLSEINGSAAIIVANNGKKLPDLEYTELFKPFITTKPLGASMGMGLYYVKTIMSAMSGEPVVLSEISAKDLNLPTPLDGAAFALVFKESV